MLSESDQSVLVRLNRHFVVDPVTGCWRWFGSRAKGYGRISMVVDGRRVPRQAHRVMYEILVGPVPAELDLDHVRARGCTGRECINPAHLEPVTRSVNLRRGLGPAITTQRARSRSHCARGHALTPDNIKIKAGHGHRKCTRLCRACLRETIQRGNRRRQERAMAGAA